MSPEEELQIQNLIAMTREQIETAIASQQTNPNFFQEVMVGNTRIWGEVMELVGITAEDYLNPIGSQESPVTPGASNLQREVACRTSLPRVVLFTTYNLGKDGLPTQPIARSLKFYGKTKYEEELPYFRKGIW